MLKEQKKTISSLEINIETLKKQRIDNKILLEVGNWYEKYHILKENRNCYLVNVINRERDVYMCEILDKKEIQRRERERAKRAIKIN